MSTNKVEHSIKIPTLYVHHHTPFSWVIFIVLCSDLGVVGVGRGVQQPGPAVPGGDWGSGGQETGAQEVPEQEQRQDRGVSGAQGKQAPDPAETRQPAGDHQQEEGAAPEEQHLQEEELQQKTCGQPNRRGGCY